jgi:iron complex outermembrane receptor protein
VRKTVIATSIAALAATSQLAFSQAMLEEVIVTAEKRATSIQDTPIAVSAFSQGDLDAQLINDTMNLQFNVPSLTMTKSNFNGSDVRIRGVGSGAIGPAGDAGVGIHMNGAYLWSSRVFEGQYYDSERVEVLRGPQGTLYGRNTTGGAINVITNKADPTEMSGNIELTAGNYNATQMRGYINMPITDNLAVRFAGMQLQRDGFINNQFTGNDIDDRDMWGGRLSVNWTPTDATEVNLTVQHFDEDDARARSQKSACKKDPSGILGCLPGYNDVYETIHSASGISGTLTAQIGQIASGIYGVNAALAGLQAQALAGAGDAAGAAAAQALAAEYGAYAAQALFPVDDYAVDTNPDGMRTANMDYEPTYAAGETIVTLDIKQDLGDMTLSILGGYSKAFVDSTEDYEKSVASETWAPQIAALANLANVPAIDAATYTAYGLPASIAAFASNAVTGVPGVGLWAGNPMMSGLANGIPMLMPNGGYVNQFSNYGADRSKSESEEFTAEVRLITDFDGDFNFQVGAFYMDVENMNHYIVRSSGLSLIGAVLPVNFGFFPAPLGDPNDPRSRFNPYMQGYDNDSRSYEVSTWAVFGEAYYQLTDQLKATVGLRYSDEQKDGVQRTIYVTFLDLPTEANNGDFYYPTYEDSQTSWKLNLTYDYSDDIMFYATASSSFKSGGFNPISADSPLVQADPRNASFEPEFIDAFEVGMKATLLDGAMRLNGTYFFYDYQDLQVSRIVGVTSLNGNTDSEISGLEIELDWALSEKWILSAQASFVDTEILDYQVYDTTDPNGQGTTDNLISINGNNYLTNVAPEDCEAGAIVGGAADGLCPGIPKDQSGNELANTPGASINIGLSYLTELGGHPLTLSTNYYWQDDMYSRNENEKKDVSPSWEVWNASARYEDSDGKWYADVWVKNILDDDYITGMYSTAQVSSLFTNQFLLDPRTYGLTVGYRF